MKWNSDSDMMRTLRAFGALLFSIVRILVILQLGYFTFRLIGQDHYSEASVFLALLVLIGDSSAKTARWGEPDNPPAFRF